MADNFSFTPGTGATAASDDIAGVHYPRLKLVTGADGTNGGDVTVSNPYPVAACAVSGGGWTLGRLLSAATTNATLVKSSAGTLGVLNVSNTNAAVRYLKFYNKATSPTVGTDTPVLTFLLPANSAVSFNLGSAGLKFTTGIGFGLTTGIGDSDTGAVAVNEIILNYGYV